MTLKSGLEVSGHSRSLKLVPFESLGAVSYSPSIVTMAVSVAVCEIFSVKEWCDLENKVRVRSRSLVKNIFSQYGSQIHNVYDLKNLLENTFFGDDP